MNKIQKVQKRKVGVSGGFINQMMGNNSTEPKVGEPCTILSYSDREAWEVIEVAEDKLSCKIRKLNSKFIGSSYGDERYEYKSDETNVTRDLEWYQKQGKWYIVWEQIEIIKSLQKKLRKEFPFGGAFSNLPNGVTFDQLIEDPETFQYGDSFKLIDGVTKSYKKKEEVSIIFGRADEYRDPSF